MWKVKPRVEEEKQEEVDDINWESESVETKK